MKSSLPEKKEIPVSLKKPFFTRERIALWLKIIGFVVVITLSVALRLLVLQRSLPLHPHPDEKDFIVRTINMIRRVSFDPGWYGLPGTVFMYLLYPLYLILFLRDVPVFATLQTMSGDAYKYLMAHQWADYVPNLMTTYMIARGLNVFLSIVTIILLFILVRKLFNNFHIALLSALMLSFAPLFIGYGTLTRTDILTVLLILLSAIVFYDTLQTNSKRKLVLASFIAGIALATRYHAIVATIPIGLFALYTDFKSYKLKDFWRFIRDSIYLRTSTSLAILAVFLGFYLSTPYTLLNWKHTILDIKFEARTVHPGAERLPGIQNWLWYIPEVLIGGVGSIELMLAALFGFVVFFRRYWLKKDIPMTFISLFPFLFYAFIAMANLRWSRWMIPVLPYECMFAAFGINECVSWITKQFTQLQKVNNVALFWVFGLITFSFGIATQVDWIRRVQTYDNDLNVISWIKENISEKDKASTVIEGIPGMKLAQYAKQNGFTFIDVAQTRAAKDENIVNKSTYLLIVKDASKSLYCYSLPVSGSVDEGDLLCAGDILDDAGVKTRLEKSYSLEKTIEQDTYTGLTIEVYHRK